MIAFQVGSPTFIKQPVIPAGPALLDVANVGTWFVFVIK